MNALMSWCVPDGVFWTAEDRWRVFEESRDALLEGLAYNAKRLRYLGWKGDQHVERLQRILGTVE